MRSSIGQLLGVYNGRYGPEGDTCVPSGGISRDHVIRLTHSSVQSFLAGVVNTTVAGPALPGTFPRDAMGRAIPPAPGTYVTAAGTPALWTGDLDCPPTTEPAARAAAGCAARDADGDGLIGARDNCLGFSNIGQAGADASRTLTCKDSRGISHSFDCANDGAALALALDPDRDGIPTLCDNCPDDKNRNQADCDADGFGDACASDRDNDSVPDVCDNCAGMPNTDQADCNQDALLAVNRNALALGLPTTPAHGDVCDPVPCARSTLQAHTELVGTPAIGDIYRSTFNVLEFDAIKSGAPQVARTGFRFCRCEAALDDSVQSRMQCVAAGSGRGDGNCRINALTDYDAAEQLPWRMITVRASETSGLLLTPGSEIDLTYDAASAAPDHELRTVWSLHEKDVPRWRARFPFEFFPVGTGPDRPLSGVLWTHTLGSDGVAFSAGQRNLSSNYQSGRFGGTMDLLRVTIPLIESRTIISHRGWDWLGDIFLVGLKESNSITPQPALFVGGGVLAQTAPNESIGFDAKLFVHDGTWVAASEPMAALVRDGMRNVALSATGSVERIIVETGGKLSSQMPPKNLSSKMPSSFAPSPPSFSAKAPPPVSVFSATRSQLWTFASASNQSKAAVLVRDLEKGSSELRDLPSVGAVLASVYSARSQVLWVLDQVVDAQGRPEARLLVVAPDLSTIEVVGRWPRRNENDRFALAVDPVGRLYVAAGRDKSHVVAQLRTDVKGSLVGSAVRAGAETLESGMLRADERGVRLLAARGSAAVLLSYESTSFLQGGVELCF